MFMTMILLKNNQLLQILLLCGAIYYIVGCSEDINEEDQKEFINSKVYKEYLSYYDNKDEIIYHDKKFLTILGESSFLDCSNYDFYMIYLYSDEKDNNSLLYTLSSIEGMVVSSIKKFNIRDSLFRFKISKQELNRRLQFNISTKIIEKNKWMNCKSKLDEAVKKITKNGILSEYHAPTRTIYYYDGRDYYALSDQMISKENMDEIDKFIRESDIWK